MAARDAVAQLGRRLMQARLESGLTRAEVAKRLGYHPNTIYQHETGRIRLSAHVLQRYADLYDRPLSWFYGEEEPGGIELEQLLERQQRELERLRRLLERRKIPTATVTEATAEDVQYVPLIGVVCAGEGLYAEENLLDEYPLPREWLPGGSAAGCFLLKVQGESMAGAGILDGDIVLCKQTQHVESGQVAVVLLDNGDAVIRRIHVVGPGRVLLMSENPNYPPLEVPEARIQARVLLRITNYAGDEISVGRRE